MPPSGWNNDPNGVIFWRGRYHLFYQQYPYQPRWKRMHWGHASSSDLLSWRDEPVALAPTEPYEDDDAGGCFSGSAVEREDGSLALNYTAHCNKHSPKETQCVAFSNDGARFVKHPGNPVIREIPPQGSEDFRDPKVWRHDGRWFMVVGTGRDGVGKVVLYESLDLLTWKFRGAIWESDGSLGTMWECPDFFPLGDRGDWVLVFSPMGLGRLMVKYAIGTFDYDTGRFLPRVIRAMDAGPDFYAPQSMDAQGRRIQIGWMFGGGAEPPTVADGFFGGMTLPRVLTLSDDGSRVLVNPPVEVERLRAERLAAPTTQSFAPGQELAIARCGPCAELQIEVDQSDDAVWSLDLRRSADGRERTTIQVDARGRKISLDRGASGASYSGIYTVELSSSATLSLRIFLDRASIEVFVNGGAEVMTSRIFPAAESVGGLLRVEHGKVKVRSLTVWRLSQ